MKVSTALILGGAALVILVIWSRSSSGSPFGTKQPTSPNFSTVGTFLGGAGVGAGLAKLFSGGGSSPSTTNTTWSVSQPSVSQDTQNQITDATAAGDTATGVIGFGGWGDE